MKLLLALLALLTGFSVADGVRVAEPSIAQGDGAVRAAWIAADEAQVPVHAAVYLVAATLAFARPALLALHWTPRALVQRAAPTVRRSDRLRQ